MPLKIEDLIPVRQIKREGISRFGTGLHEHRSRPRSVLSPRTLLLHLFKVAEIPETLLHLFQTNFRIPDLGIWFLTEKGIVGLYKFDWLAAQEIWLNGIGENFAIHVLRYGTPKKGENRWGDVKQTGPGNLMVLANVR